ncbi:Dihydroxy-acid dehydratase [Balamuthia mandrillaris]
MLRAVGWNDQDFEKPLVAVACPQSDILPCNSNLGALGELVKEEVVAIGGKPFSFGTPVVSDGETMGTEGMKYSLASRDLIADCIEMMYEAYNADGIITFGGCDKTIPGALMPLARNNAIGVTLYGGTTLSGKYKGKDLNIASSFEAIGAHASGSISKDELHQIECHSCPGHGSCGGMFTANTMASAIEALGMSVTGSSSNPAVDRSNKTSKEKAEDCRKSVRALRHLMERGIRTRDIMSRQAFENAITVMMALGGSTNGVLHLLALAREADVPLSIEDFNTIASRVPLIGNFKPFGEYLMEDLHHIGGVPLVMKVKPIFSPLSPTSYWPIVNIRNVDAIGRRPTSWKLYDCYWQNVERKLGKRCSIELPAPTKRHSPPRKTIGSTHEPYCSNAWQFGARRRCY